jgi:hypothetical protein
MGVSVIIVLTTVTMAAIIAAAMITIVMMIAITTVAMVAIMSAMNTTTTIQDLILIIAMISIAAWRRPDANARTKRFLKALNALKRGLKMTGAACTLFVMAIYAAASSGLRKVSANASAA